MHAPYTGFLSGALCETIAQHPSVARSGEIIDCLECLSKLQKQSQWANTLVKAGYLFSARQRKVRAPKSDPRQVSIGEDDDA